MKTIYLLLLTFAIFAGCMSTVDVAGMSLDTYVQNNGIPQSSYDLQNGNKLYFFKTLCSNGDYKEYNVEVTPDNILIKETVTRNCSYSSYQNSAYPIYTYQDYLKQKYDRLNDEYARVSTQKVTVSEEWIKSQKAKGVVHPDTVALKQKYDNLVAKERELQAEMETTRKRIE